jgi:hypothetical protein
MTMEADPVVTANYASTFQAFPLFPFLFQKALNAVLFDKHQVPDYTHMIVTTIAFIERFKATAWKIITIIAEAYKPFTQQVALFAHVYAVLAAWTATGTIGLIKTFLLQVVLHCQVVGAYAAVNPARSYKFFAHVL